MACRPARCLCGMFTTARLLRCSSITPAIIPRPASTTIRALCTPATGLPRLHPLIRRPNRGFSRQRRGVSADWPGGRLWRLPVLVGPGRSISLARRRTGRFSTRVYVTRRSGLRGLGGSGVGMLCEKPGAGSGRRRRIHRAPHHPNDRCSVRRFRQREQRRGT